MVSIARSRPLIIAGIVVTIVITLVVLLIGLISIFQERIAFQPQGPPYPQAVGGTLVEYSAADGQRLIGYVAGKPSPDKPLLIAFHGNADMAVLQLDWANEIFRRTGVPVLVAEYRGYAGLSGRPTYEGSRLDADAAYDFATKSLNVSPDSLAFFGHSLGSAIATELASRHSPFVLMLQSPFTSARDMAKAIVGHRPSEFSWKIFSRIHYDTIERVGHLNAPVSVAHGGQDRLIPLIMGQAIFDSAKVKGKWLMVPNAAHNDVALRGGEPYWEWVVSSLRLRSGNIGQKKTGA